MPSAAGISSTNWLGLDARHDERGQAAGDVADHGHPLVLEPEGGRHDDAAHHHDQGGGDAPRDQAQGDQRRQRDQARRRPSRRRSPRGCGRCPTSCSRTRSPSTSTPRSFSSWPDDEHDRDPVDVAHQHRVGEVVGHPAQPGEAGDPEDAAHHQREHRGQGRVLGRDRRRPSARAPSPPAPRWPRRAPRSAGARSPAARSPARQQQRVQADHRAQARDLGVRHPRGQGDAATVMPAEQVAPHAGRAVARERGGDRRRRAAEGRAACGPEGLRVVAVGRRRPRWGRA